MTEPIKSRSSREVGSGVHEAGALRSRSLGFLALLLISVYGLVLVRTAWVGDDAFIMFRTVDHFVHGRGLVWNLGERVQAYTPPLWMFLVSAVYSVTGEIYFSSIALCCAVSLAAVIIFVWRLAPNRTAATVGLLILLLSKCFVEYSTSGLENPLTHLLLAVFIWLALENDGSARGLCCLSLAGGMLVLNRMDLAVLIVPAFGYVVLRVRRRAAIWAVMAGLAPFFLWELLSLVYYGFPFPNTAYAKVRTGISAPQLARQGLFYILNFIQQDILSAAVIGTALVVPFFSRMSRYVPFAFGLLLHGIYTLYIGGDFMSGRFFSAPLFCAVCVLAHGLFSRLRTGEAILTAGMCVLAGMSSPHPPLLSDANYGANRQDIVNGSNIADERAYYYPSNGLLRMSKYSTGPEMPNVQLGLSYAAGATPLVISGTTGMTGFYAGPDVYILDYHALSEPLLARLPVQSSYNFVIGHYYRPIPVGYEETLRTGQNRIQDKNLAQFWEILRLVTRGPLFDPKRLVEIVKLNCGVYDHLLRAYSDAKQLSWANLPSCIVDGSPWDAAGVIKLPYTGGYVYLGRTHHSSSLVISLNAVKDWQLFYFRGERLVARQFLPSKPDGNADLMATFSVEVPFSAKLQGYDRIGIMPPLPHGTKLRFGLGHLTLGVQPAVAEGAR